MRIKHRVLALAIILRGLAIASARAGPEMSRGEVRRQARALADLGRALFFDPSLSESGHLSCSSCHDPAHGSGPANERAVQLGGGDMHRPGARAVPSLKYLQAVPP